MSYPVVLGGGWSEVAGDIDQAVMDGDRRFGRRQPGLLLLAAMTEELGETAKAFLHEQIEMKPVAMSSYHEAAQLAGIVIRFMREWKDIEP